MGIFDELDQLTEPEKILRPPFAYPGGKSRLVQAILPKLPYRHGYIEPFGGSGIILLNRRPSKLEVFNDRYSGVVAFYRCLRDEDKLWKLCDKIEHTIHSREDFIWCKKTWYEDTISDVERAFRWYYMITYSFSSLGRNYGRSIKGGSGIGKLRNKIRLLPIIHERLKQVQIENQDWRECIRDYDSSKNVFYVDPPYIDANTGIYPEKMTRNDHRDLLDIIFNSKGFFAVSGYSNPLYENKDWDDRFEWKSFVSIQSNVWTEGNKKLHLKGIEKNDFAKEILWIKEAR